MKLEKIILNGFKSFADKTEFQIGDGITAIVGPNGCGKSNVVDAVKWVLGDQSPKSLRSGQMTDVIFSGSGTRKPSSMSEVSLVFSEVSHAGSNGDHLQVTRRLYRSGESEYLINQKTCRLKDIREFFMDTGVGMKAYSIIEQGQIDQLLRANRDDRRLIFEEAAGISKFKAHKKEALRKLERTEQNLLRLADIITEVQKQLRSIKLQAGKARNYLEYTQRLKQLRVNYSLAEYDKLIHLHKEKDGQLSEINLQFGEIVKQVGQLDAQVSELGQAIIEKENLINRCDNSLVSAKGRIEQQLERIQMLTARITELKGRIEQSGQEVRTITEQMKSFEQQSAEARIQSEEIETGLKEKNSQVTEHERLIHDINARCGSLEAELEDEKSGVIDSVRRTAQLHNEIESMNSYRKNLSGQKDRLTGKALEARQQLENALAQRAAHHAKSEDIQSVLCELQTTLDAKRAEMAEIDVSSAVLSDELAQLKEQRSALTSEYNLLNDMHLRREGISDTIQSILTTHSDREDSFIEGILADIISADIEHAPAAEGALEGLTDALIINSTPALLACEQLHGELSGRVSILCMDKLAPFTDSVDLSRHEGVLGRMVEFVSFAPKYTRLAWALLGKVILVDSVNTAMELASHMGRNYKFVTPAGEVYNGSESLRIGPLGREEGLISRKSRIHDLEEQIASLHGRIAEKQEALSGNHRQNEHLEKVCKNLRTSIYEANTEKIDTESHIKLLDQNIDRLKNEQPLIAGEIEGIEKEISDSVQREYETKKRLDEEEAIKEERNQRISQLQSRLDEQKADRDRKVSMLTELRIELGAMKEQKNSLQQKLSSIQSQLQHSRIRLESHRNEMQTCDEQVQETQRNILSSQARVSELYVEKEELEKQSRTLHEDVSDMIARRQNNDAQLREKRKTQEEIEQKIHTLDLELNEIKVKHEGLTQRVLEELGIEIEKAYEDYEQQDINWEEVRTEIHELKGKIERLGNVNVDAIGQQEELEERFEFLSSQVEDLNKSKIQLEQLIQKINAESRDKFQTTFEEVRQNFQDLFRKLFGGGKADVILENPEEILESGIEIYAKPPGKQPRTISQLSGGEKTLTAIALQFAIFKSKPSPFCFLDEVDAALDEANNERFNLIVREFQQNSQFVIITHSKRTMSIADILFGVTMQTQGVSKKISVRFDESQTAVA